MSPGSDADAAEPNARRPSMLSTYVIQAPTEGWESSPGLGRPSVSRWHAATGWQRRAREG